MTHTIASPGTTPGAVTGGPVSNSRNFAPQLHVTEPAPAPSGLSGIDYAPGDGPGIPKNFPAAVALDVQSLDGTGLACSSLPLASMSGKLAFVQRGTCTFSTKVNNAATAGAVAVLVYNNVPAGDAIPMGGLGSTAIPAVMISNLDGLA